MNMTARFQCALIIALIGCLGLSPKAVAQAAVAGRVVEETVELFASRAAQHSAHRLTLEGVKVATERLATKFGDDAVRLVLRDGGPELLECVVYHGDEIMEFALKASPEGRRALASCATELLPHMKRVGVAALELEAKAPGLATKFFRVFGDETAVALAKSAPPHDLPRLLRMAEAADSPATRDLLMRSYAERGSALLDKIPPKLVIATGLSAAMIIVALESTAPFRSLADSIESNPELAKDAVKEFASSSTTVLSVIGIAVLAGVVGLIYLGVRRLLPQRAS